MAVKTCPICGGSYERDQRGGVYLHACAPVVDKLIITRSGAVMAIDPATAKAGDVEVDRTYKERPNKVDETTLTAQTKGG